MTHTIDSPTADTLSTIKEYDLDFKKRYERLSTPARRKKRCIWPECESFVTAPYHLEMCSKCRTKHYKNLLLCVDVSLFNPEERIELYKDVIEFSEEHEMTVGEVLAWLLTEGLNAFDEKKENSKKEDKSVQFSKKKRRRKKNGYIKITH